VLAAIAGPDAADPSSALAAPPDYPALLGGGLAGIAVGLDEAFVCEDVDPEVSAAVLAGARVLAELGAALTPVAFPRLEADLGHALAGFAAEIALAHADTYPSHAKAYGGDLRSLLEAAQQVSGRDVVLAQRRRIALRRRIEALLQAVPLVLLPAMPFVTPTAAEGVDVMRDPARQQRATRFTVMFNLSGHPTVTLPCGFDRRGFPIGMQLVGRALDEALLLRAAHAFQQVTDWHVRRPL
jgi:amidase